MVQLTDAKELFKILNRPGTIGVKNGDKIEQINTSIVLHAPVLEVMKSLHNNQFFVESTCQI